MEGKRQIDRIRESGGQTTIGEKEEAVQRPVEIDHKLIIIKERSIHEFFHADFLDPDRTSIELANAIQKLLLNCGTESELVARTFLTAVILFDQDFVNFDVDIGRVLKLSLELLHELVILEKEVNEYLLEEKKGIEDYVQRTGNHNSITLPSISNLKTRCKTIFQKAQQVEQILITITKLFYSSSKLDKRAYFETFYRIINQEYGDADPFVKFIKGNVAFMQFIRGGRNSLDHRQDTSVEVADFTLRKPDFELYPPTIKLARKDVTLPETPLASVLISLMRDMISLIEGTIVFLADKHAKFNFTYYEIREIPENKKKYRHLNYSFWSPTPFNDEGFFHQ